MPNLPTLTVTDEQASRITAAYGTVAAYKAWLKQQIIDYVLAVEERQHEQSYVAERIARRNAGETDLNTAQ